MKTLSVIMPVYNEKHTLSEILKRVEAVKLENLNKEIILVDDMSTDGTRDILRELESKYNKQFSDVYEALNYLMDIKKADEKIKKRTKIGYKA